MDDEYKFIEQVRHYQKVHIWAQEIIKKRVRQLIQVLKHASDAREQREKPI